MKRIIVGNKSGYRHKGASLARSVGSEGEGITEEQKERAVKAFVSKSLNLIREEKGQQNYA